MQSLGLGVVAGNSCFIEPKLVGCLGRCVVVTIEVGYARLLSPAAQEVLRLRVVAALKSGRVGSYRQAAEVFGVSQRSVGTWWRAYRSLGRGGCLYVFRQAVRGVLGS
ncbi:helix-turn-helix domain-containing protein [Streptomyces sp. NPDC094468]|uniref:helix-turn-helix domain-containing protein n=1 Tax=Streptomyces sp. NPDC094468 TaxID=3366066 RepID=UPI003823CF88